jgi:SAM-dependent methyltransferase
MVSRPAPGLCGRVASRRVGLRFDARLAIVDVWSGYDAVAADYVDRFGDELGDKPFDARMLDWLAERVGSIGPVCDMGCGPGQVAAYLAAQGYEVCGVDLSSEMVRHAERINPSIPFEQGDMRDLDAVADSAYGGVAAFYSIVNLPQNEHPHVFREMCRVIRRRGWMLLSFHVGEGTTHVDEFLGAAVSLDFHFFQPAVVRQHLTDAGFDVTEVIEREPYDESVEAQTKRAYLFARKR